MLASAFSGVPNAGAPERISTLEVNPPYMTGEPGAASWPNRIQYYDYAAIADALGDAVLEGVLIANRESAQRSAQRALVRGAAAGLHTRLFCDAALLRVRTASLQFLAVRFSGRRQIRNDR